MGDSGGGVWDWTDSLYEPHLAASTTRVLRGGGWHIPVDNARTTNRIGCVPELQYIFIGFRPARSVTT